MRLTTYLQSLSRPVIKVRPATSLFDAPVEISVANLPTNSSVLLKTTLICPTNKLHFESLNRYKSDANGHFNTGLTAPLPGSHYKCVHGSGPLWSVIKKEGSKTFLWNIGEPFVYNLAVLDENNTKLGETTLSKTFLDPSVTRIGVSQGNVQGCLFLPPQKPASQTKLTKAVITVDGLVDARGRVYEGNAALLASKGFVTFALGFFGCKGQPKMYNHIDLEKVEESVDFLRGLSQVEDKRIGLLGRSRGGDICMALAAFLGDKIGGTVVINNPFASMPGDTVYRNQRIKGTDFVRPPLTSDFRMVGGEEAFGRDEKRQVPVELVRGPVLSIQGAEDSFAKFFNYQSVAEARAKRAGKLDFEAVVYPGLGHLLAVPNSPACFQALNLHSLKQFDYGGRDVEAHSLATNHAWERAINFFKQY